jgi:hypothetical protein
LLQGGCHIATRDRPLLMMLVLCDYDSDSFLLAKARPDGETRGKWRIPDAKDESDLFSFSDL